MANDIAPWNLLQIAFIAVFPAWQSFTRMPSGMSLLAVYLYLLVLCIPPMFIQLKLGNHQQKGIVGLLSRHIPIFKGVGITLLIQLFLVCVYMVPLVTHYGMYAFIAISQSPYVWGQCDNAWNTDRCSVPTISNPALPEGAEAGISYTGLSQDTKIKMSTPQQEFLDHEYLQVSGNISDIGGFPVWHFSKLLDNVNISILPLAMLTVWTLIFLAICFGGRVCGWLLFLLGCGFLSLIFTVLGYGYSNLNKNGTDTFLNDLYKLDLEEFKNIDKDSDVLKDWTKGFLLIMHSIPIWTAIFPTMGKMTGTGRLSRNISWLLVLLVYAATCQIPQLTMAPYIGNLFYFVKQLKLDIRGIDVIFNTMAAAFVMLEVPSVYMVICPVFVEEPKFMVFRIILRHSKHATSTRIDVIFNTMAAAFVMLEVPPVYAMLFYLAIFIAGLMFLIVAMFTILDNLTDSLTDWVDMFQEKRGCVNFCGAFVLMALGVGASILHTTKAGVYYVILMDQCVSKLYFLTVILLGVCIIIIYVKQNFGIAERIIMCVWCVISTVITAGIFLYCFIDGMNTVPGYRGVKIKGTWDLICWILASAPFLAVPAAMIHSFQQEEGSFSKKLKYLFCGTKQDNYDPPHEYGYHRPEPSAPPYGTSSDRTYAYMDDNSYQMEEVPYYKIHD